MIRSRFCAKRISVVPAMTITSRWPLSRASAVTVMKEVDRPAEPVGERVRQRKANGHAAALDASVRLRRPVADAYPVTDCGIGCKLNDNAPGLSAEFDIDHSLAGEGLCRGQDRRRRRLVG